MIQESNMCLWDVYYTDQYGNKQCVKYCAESEEMIKRLFSPEKKRGAVLESIRKIRDCKNIKDLERKTDE